MTYEELITKNKRVREEKERAKKQAQKEARTQKKSRVHMVEEEGVVELPEQPIEVEEEQKDEESR